MLAIFRRFLGTWPARVLFLVLVLAFATWGVGDTVRQAWRPTWVAKVAGRSIQLPELQDAYQRDLAQVTRMYGGQIEPTPEIRRSVAAQALERLITQAAITAEVDRLGLAVPDAELRDATFGMTAFHGPSGKFDRPTFENAIRNAGMTEPHFLDLLRTDLRQQQLLAPVRYSAAAPDALVAQVFAFQQEKRVADTVELPFADAPAPPAPTDAILQRWWDNHPDLFSTPEQRRIKAVVLAPDTLAKDIDIPDADLRAAYDQRKAEYVTPERRSVDVILVQDQARAASLAAQWRAGADWAAMQDAAKQAGASGVELPDASAAEFPVPELAQAAFAAPLDSVPDPVKSALGWHVLKVTKVTPGLDRRFDDVKAELRDRLARDKAADQLYEHANKVEDALAGGATLDQLPGDLGLAAVTGTLDAQGNTAAGTPAPIPGPPELRAALIAAAFKAQKGDAARLQDVPAEGGGPSAGYYAVVVEDIVPPARKPFAEVRDAVLTDWTTAARRHEQDAAAAKLLAAIKGGQSMADAATVAGLAVRRSSPVGRTGDAPGVPAQLVAPLFSLKPGEPTMIETPDGFVVAVLAEVQAADPKADPIGYGQVRDQLSRSIGEDLQTVLASALRDRGNPQVNRAQLDTIVPQ